MYCTRKRGANGEGTKAQSPGVLARKLLAFAPCPRAPSSTQTSHPQGRMFPSMHLMNRVACVPATLEIDPHRGMRNAEWANGECGRAQRGRTHPTHSPTLASSLGCLEAFSPPPRVQNTAAQRALCYDLNATINILWPIEP